MIKFTELKDYLLDCVGSCYLWGGQGESVEKLKADDYAYVYKKETSKANAERVIKFIKKHEATTPNMRAYDCSGLGVAFLLEKKEIQSDMTAHGIFKKCKEIKKAELQKGDMLFRWNKGKTKIEHIGYYIGLNCVVHAKGRDYGVIAEAIDDSWNAFGRSPWIEEEGFIFTESLDYNKCHRQVREDVKELQKMLIAEGYDLGPWGADGEFGAKTTAAVKSYQRAKKLKVDGIAGRNTITSLGGIYNA